MGRGGGSEGALVSADQLGTGPHWDRQGSTEPHRGLAVPWGHYSLKRQA